MKKRTFIISAVMAVLVFSFAALGRSPEFFNEIIGSVKESPITSIFFGGKAEQVSKKTETANAQPARTTGDGSTQMDETVPDEIVYFIMFNHLVRLKGEAEAAQSRGENIDYLRMYQEPATLNAAQSAQLFVIAQECMDAVKPLDTQARAIIDQVRADAPGGYMLSKKQLPAPPPELQTLQNEKNAAILRYRDNLKSYLGDQKFEQFNEFARARIVPNLERNLKVAPPAAAPVKPAKEVR